jgi:hypothetical protein
MKNLGITILFLFFLSVCNGQTKSQDSILYAKSIKSQAETMRQLLLKKDYKAFIKFTYPTLIEVMGGEKKMIELMETGGKKMESEGTKFLNITIGEPTPIIVIENELQSTVQQTIELKIPNARMITQSTLIAISTDNGTNWYFVDTAGKDIQAMQRALPNLSSDLVIPERPEPIFYDD